MPFFHNYDKTILAKGLSLTLDTWSSHLNNNVMLVGASGRGKSRNFIKPNIMQMNTNYVISDPKGVLLRELGTMLEDSGYRIKVLNLIDMQHSNSYNPFHYIRCDADVYKMIDYLMVNVNPQYMHSRDPFWDNATKALLSAVCFYIYYTMPEIEHNFNTVMRLLRLVEVRKEEPEHHSELDRLFEILEAKDPHHIAVKQYKIFKAGTGRTIKSILITAEVYLQHFNLWEYIRLTSTDDMELEQLTDVKLALFVVVSDTDRSKNWLAGVFYSQLFDLLCSRETNSNHTRFFLDDFACTAKIPDFDDKMAMIRSRNLSCVIAVQDEAQLEKEYGKAAQGIITNCDSYVFLGASNVDICDVVAHRLGDRHISGADIRKMSYEECVVICGNQGGIYKKYEVEKHPRYKLTPEGDPSVRHYIFIKKTGDPVLDEIEELKERFFARAASSNINFRTRLTNLDRVDSRNGTFANSFFPKTKDTIFDSDEEKALYSALHRIEGLAVFPHQHLRDVFTSTDDFYSKKLSLMHCDFIIRDMESKVLFGIEIDGSQHCLDEKQMANDIFKNEFFKANGIPLLRFTAKDVRENIKRVMDAVIETTGTVTGKTYTIEGETLPEIITPSEDDLLEWEV